jgi:hypothetical protein
LQAFEVESHEERIRNHFNEYRKVHPSHWPPATLTYSQLSKEDVEFALYSMNWDKNEVDLMKQMVDFIVKQKVKKELV